jgi:putative membrane protein
MNPSSRKPTNDTTELAKERNREAAERTLTCWIGNSLLLMGFGISIEEIHSAMNRSFPQNTSEINLQFTDIISLAAIAFGIVMLIPIAINHRMEIKSLEQEDYLARPSRFLNLFIVVGSVILFGMVALAAVILVISQT